MTDAEKITNFLATVQLGYGVGTKKCPCSIAAINLAMNGRLIDDIPDCMSLVIGKWIIGVQDAMPLDRLNGPRWRALLPMAAGTGRDHEAERLEIIMDWMWGAVMPQLQPMADAEGLGAEWKRMTAERTEAAARAAAAAARAADAARTVTMAAAAASRAVTMAAAAAAEAARAADRSFWDAIDPETLLSRLIAVSGEAPS